MAKKMLGSGKKLAKGGGGGGGGGRLIGKTEKISGPGHLLVNHGTHGILGIASRELGPVSVPFLNVKANPDTLGLVAAGAAFVFGGKKLKKLAYSAGSGAAHAIEGRMIWSPKKLERTASVSGTDESTLEATISRIVEKSVAAAVAKIREDESAEPAEEAAA